MSAYAGLGSLARHERGAVAIVTALSLPMLVAGAAFGVETSYWHYKHLQLQAAADTAAYAGAIEKRAGGKDGLLSSAITQATADNGLAPLPSITVNSPPLTGAYRNDRAVEVVLEQRLKRYFTKLFLKEDVLLRARAVAIYEDAGDACVLALDPAQSKAALFSGSSTTKFVGCSVMSNSLASDAVTVQGSGKLESSCIYSTGGVRVGAGVTLTACAAPKTNLPAVGDPFKDLIAPPTVGPCMNKSTATLLPGVYCGGLSLSGTVTLSPGVYVITGGDLRVNANTNLSGSGVTIYVSDNARVSINGTATVNLSAPTVGPYSGVLFFGDRANSGGGKNIFNGTAASSLTGSIYFANQAVQYNGNFSGEGGCTQVVARTVEWSGNATVQQDCSSRGMRRIQAAQIVKLVE